MKAKNIISILIIYFFFSCSDKKNELEYLICKDSIQYWNYEWPHTRSDFYGFTFSFNKNGDVVKYSFSKEKNERRYFNDSHVPGYSKWSVNKDSVFSFMESSWKIIKYTEDTIYVKKNGKSVNEYFIRVKGDLRIIEEKPVHNSSL